MRLRRIFPLVETRDPDQALGLIRRRHPGASVIRPLHVRKWTYRWTGHNLDGVLIGSQHTSAFSASTARDSTGLRVNLVLQGTFSAQVAGTT